jgi:hypothetical protein
MQSVGCTLAIWGFWAKWEFINGGYRQDCGRSRHLTEGEKLAIGSRGLGSVYLRCFADRCHRAGTFGPLSSTLAAHELSKKRHAEIQISMVSAEDHALRDDC